MSNKYLNYSRKFKEYINLNIIDYVLSCNGCSKQDIMSEFNIDEKHVKKLVKNEILEYKSGKYVVTDYAESSFLEYISKN